MSRTKHDYIVSLEDCKAIGAEIDAAIKPIFERRGYVIDKERQSYGPSFGVKVEAHPARVVDGIDMNGPDVQRFLNTDFYLRPEAIGATVMVNGKPRTFLGLTRRGRFVLRDPDGIVRDWTAARLPHGGASVLPCFGPELLVLPDRDWARKMYYPNAPAKNAPVAAWVEYWTQVEKWLLEEQRKQRAKAGALASVR